MGSVVLDPQLVLKTSPPRLSDALIPRDRLALEQLGMNDTRVVVIQAASGAGKTSLLTQWRRACQARGAAVVWLALDEDDDALRLAHGLGSGLVSASGQRAAGPAFMNWLGGCQGGTEALTGLLVEIAEQAFDVVIMLDNFERSQNGALREAMAYLVRNMPPNLQLIVSTRPGAVFDIVDLADRGYLARVSGEDLAFTLDEAIAIFTKSFSAKISMEAIGRLHELTEGWPLGVQLVIATLKKSRDVDAAAHAISASTGDLHRYFVESLINGLETELSDFLTRISIFDLVHPALCRAVFPECDALGLLERLERETPVLLHAEDSSWMRLHGLARDFLLTRFRRLHSDERCRISLRACDWLGEQGLYEQAAHHAALAGQQDKAFALAEKVLDQLGHGGRVSEVLKWIDRLPASELKRRPALWTSAAWSLALNNRRQEAERIVQDILSEQPFDPARQFEATLISAVAASFDDRPERLLECIEPWIERPLPPVDTRTLRVYKDTLGFLNFQRHDIAKARQLWMEAARVQPGELADYSSSFAEFGIGLTYFWEGQFHLAERFLRASLARCEQAMGRRNAIPCMMAAVLAATLWEMGGDHEPRAILSYRIDVLEQSGLPDAVMLAYITLARLAAHDGRESYALDHLDALIALGESRDKPRLKIAGLCEQIRLHGLAHRRDAVTRLISRLEDVCSGAPLANQPLFEAWVKLYQYRARAYRAMAWQDWRAAAEHLSQANEWAEALRLERDSVEIRLLRSVASQHEGNSDVSGLLEEAISLARMGGMVRTLLDTHPDVVGLLGRVSERADFRVADLREAIAAANKPITVEQAPAARPERGYANALLTPKECEVLALMETNLTNKQIALALDVSTETVKWHAKNIFGKLSAADRAHAVKRAQILGILKTSSP